MRKVVALNDRPHIIDKSNFKFFHVFQQDWLHSFWRIMFILLQCNYPTKPVSIHHYCNRVDSTGYKRRCNGGRLQKIVLSIIISEQNCEKRGQYLVNAYMRREITKKKTPGKTNVDKVKLKWNYSELPKAKNCKCNFQNLFSVLPFGEARHLPWLQRCSVQFSRRETDEKNLQTRKRKRDSTTNKKCKTSGQW